MLTFAILGKLSHWAPMILGEMNCASSAAVLDEYWSLYDQQAEYLLEEGCRVPTELEIQF